MQRITLACAIMLVVQLAASAEESKGRIDAVTVYRGQALVTRVIDVNGPAGLHEIVVTGLPDAMLPDSIYAESADGVEIRSVRYRTRPASDDVREEVRKLDDQIRGVQDQIDANNRHIALLAEQKAYLAKLEQFVAPTATVELTKGVLNAETLKALSLFLLEQRQAVAEEELKRGVDQRTVQAQIELLNRSRQQLTEGSAKTMKEAVVFVHLREAAPNRFRLRYLVDNASWSPSYNLRADADLKEVRVEYYSSIEQMSGEDWPDVSMTLSTATPSLVAKAPVLTPLTVTLATLEAAKGKQTAVSAPVDASSYASAVQELGRKKAQAEQLRNRQMAAQSANQPQPGPADNDLQLNMVGYELQLLDLLAKGSAIRGNKARLVEAESVSVTYQLTGRMSLPSRSDQQLIQIASVPMKAEFYKLAIPVLTNYVYNEAAVTNNSTMVLLAGPVSAYVSGQFVGHGEVPTVAVGENFTVGFGIDSSLRAARELQDKSETVQGGNRVMDFTYRLAIENFGTAPAHIRLLDRLPTSKENEVRVELASTGQHALSKDSTYEQTDRKKGILRWELDVPGQSMGTTALAVEYKLRLEYDKQMQITAMPLALAQ